MFSLLHLVFALLNLGLAIWAFPRITNPSKLIAYFLLFVLFGSIYDNTVLGLGRWLGTGDLLQSLNWGRFLIHYVAVPLLIVIATEFASRSEVAWAKRPVSRSMAWALAIILIVLSIALSLAKLTLIPETFADTVRYVAQDGVPPFGAIITTFYLIVIGTFIWRQAKWSWLFWGAIIVLIGNGAPSSIFSTLPGSVTEFVLNLSLVATFVWLNQQASTG